MSLREFEQPAIDLARSLLGSVLRHGTVAGMIVETEAYLGLDDLAAHASKGKTERTKVMFGPAGYAYVYFIYGMHECLNVVAEREGSPGCVLIRALEPLSGLEVMYERRKWHGSRTGLTNGPGKLTQALAITRKEYGLRLDVGDLTIRAWRDRPSFEIETTPRIGITQCADWPLRFVWKPSLSEPAKRLMSNHGKMSRMPWRIVTLFALLSVGFRAVADEATLQTRVNEKISGFPGTVTLYAKNLRTGATFSLAGEEPVRTASTIKLAIMTECFAEAAEGKLKLSEPIKLRSTEKVSGSGILQELSDDIALPLRDVIDFMIVLSDNTATNLILDRIGGNAVNERMAALGLTQTRVMRKILGDGSKLKIEVSGVTEEGAKAENKKWGIGRSSPREMVGLLERLYRGELVNKTASRRDAGDSQTPEGQKWHRPRHEGRHDR